MMANKHMYTVYVEDPSCKPHADYQGRLFAHGVFAQLKARIE